MEPVQTYGDIVWKQFRSNRMAYWSLWALFPLTAVAVFAPLICSNQPLIFHDGERKVFPWIHALFNPSEGIDFVFNMALLAFIPWLVLIAPQLVSWNRRGIRARTRAWRGVAQYFGWTLAACCLFALPQLRPNNRYADRSFAAEELTSPDIKRGLYAPIPYGPTQQNIEASNRPPLYRAPRTDWKEANDGFPHLLGTDNAGRDVLVRMIYGTRISITIGFVAVGLYLTIGCIVGAIAGYFGGRTDILVSRVIEVIMLFPAFFLILTLVGLLDRSEFGPSFSIYIVMLVIGITGWPGIARLIRGEVLKQRSLDYVTAAQALGFSDARLILRHIIPNSLSPALVAAPFGVAGAIITEAGLSLLGLGVRPPAPSWGLLLKLGSENYNYWWLVVVPSFAIFLTVTIFNLIGNGLRDAMDPRLRSTQ